MHNIQHTHTHTHVCAHKSATIELLPQPPPPALGKMAKRESGLETTSYFPLGRDSCRTDVTPVYSGSGCCVVLRRIPWGQRRGSGLETLLLETEVLGVDLSVWLSVWGFCTYTKRWKGSHSSLLCCWVLRSCLYIYTPKCWGPLCLYCADIGQGIGTILNKEKNMEITTTKSVFAMDLFQGKVAG